LFKWFLTCGSISRRSTRPTFSKNRKRLLEHEVADEFFEAVVRLAKLRSTSRRALLGRRDAVEGVGVTQELQAQGRSAVGTAGGPQR
jgi:hypothetical protein